MSNADLHIAEIPYESGEVHFRYSRVLSEKKDKWIRHGLFVEYSPAGQVISEGMYELGKEQGLWRDFYENGQLAAEGFYEDGVEVGEWKYWDTQGNRIKE